MGASRRPRRPLEEVGLTRRFPAKRGRVGRKGAVRVPLHGARSLEAREAPFPIQAEVFDRAWVERRTRRVVLTRPSWSYRFGYGGEEGVVERAGREFAFDLHPISTDPRL